MADSTWRKLCRHFAHKVPVMLTETRGRSEFPFGPCRIEADPEQARFSIDVREDYEVVRAEVTERIAAEWGGAAKVVLLPPEAEVDPERHVIAGDIRSPKNTDAAVALMLEWIGGL